MSSIQCVANEILGCEFRKATTGVAKLNRESKVLHCFQRGICLVLFPMGQKGWLC